MIHKHTSKVAQIARDGLTDEQLVLVLWLSQTAVLTYLVAVGVS